MDVVAMLAIAKRSVRRRAPHAATPEEIALQNYQRRNQTVNQRSDTAMRAMRLGKQIVGKSALLSRKQKAYAVQALDINEKQAVRADELLEIESVIQRVKPVGPGCGEG
jgi:hypothetical protein